MSYGREGGYRRSRFGGFGDASKPKPVEVGKEYDVTITDVSRRGDGIAKIEGFIIFVPGAKTGSTLKIKVTNVGNTYANGEIAGSKEEGSSQE